jgi:hypothetical protein
MSPLWTDASQSVHSHLAHSTEDMFASHSYSTPELVGYLLFFTERMPSTALKHDKVLAVLREQKIVMIL